MEMQMEFIRELPTPQQLKEQHPIDLTMRKCKEDRDHAIADIFTGKDDRFLLIIGPCSADNEDAVVDYMHRLATVQEKIQEKILIIPRVYTNKPRTLGTGYKGMLHQPNPSGTENLLAGLIAIREMHMRVVRETGFTCAEEMLYPSNHPYLSDLLSYVAVGARSVEDQEHRLVASGVGIPAGMKNPPSGDISVMMNSITAAQHEQEFIYRTWEVKTKGNPLAHAIMRGYIDDLGHSKPNYHYENLQLVFEEYEKRELANPAIIVDTNHANSNKKFLEQIRIAKDVIHSRNVSPDIRNIVKGLMIESYIEDGAQKIGDGVYGKSITDPCLGWAKTERLLLELAELL